MYALRFSAVFIILFLLLGPLFQLKFQRIEKPILALLIDNSSSMLPQESAKGKTEETVAKLSKLQESLGEDYLVKLYSLGELTRLNDSISFSEKQSNLADGIRTVAESNYNLNLAGIILATDGIYNAGENPLYEAIEQKVKIFPIAFGDTTRKKDVWIKQVKHNEIVFEGNAFLVQAHIAANFFKGQKVNYTLSENSKVLSNGSLILNADPANEIVNLSIQASTEGLHTYQLKLEALPGDNNLANNVYTFQVESLKSKQKIVLVSQSPHPDISALGQTLKTNPNYEFYSYLIHEYKEEFLNEASLFILHQLPGNNGSGEALIKSLQQKNKSVFFITGKQSSALALNKFGIVSISGPAQNFNECQAWINDNFPLFIVDDGLNEFVKKAPPLYSLYGNYKAPADAAVLFNQQIGYVKTTQPLLFFSQAKGAKYAVLAGEGFWKWRLHDFLLNQNHTITQNLISKIVQWTAANSDQSRLRLNPIKKRFAETESVAFEAELYNESFELIQDKELSIKISGDNGRNYHFGFSKNGKGYELNAGRLGPGIYSYEAKVSNATGYPTKKGKFSVQAIQTELVQTKADHQLLNAMAIETGGTLFYPNETEKLIGDLKENAQIKPIVYEEQEVELLINFKWLFAIILLLMTGEWFIRKWNGFI